MRKSTLVGVAVSLAVLGASHGPAVASSVCYEFDEGASTLVLDIRAHSALASESDFPRQTTYSGHGKVLFDGEVLLAEAATITVGKEVGALMFVYGGLDCFSNQGSPMPQEWQCVFVNEGGEVVRFALTKVDPSINELCSFFFVPDLNDSSTTSSTSSSSDLHWRR